MAGADPQADFRRNVRSVELLLGEAFAGINHPGEELAIRGGAGGTVQYPLVMAYIPEEQKPYLLEAARQITKTATVTVSSAEAMAQRYIAQYQQCIAEQGDACLGLRDIGAFLALLMMSQDLGEIEGEEAAEALIELMGAADGGGAAGGGAAPGGGNAEMGNASGAGGGAHFGGGRRRKFKQRGGNPFTRFYNYVSAWCRRGRAVAAAAEIDANVQNAAAIIAVDVDTRNPQLVLNQARAVQETARTVATRVVAGGGAAVLLADLVNGMQGYLGTALARLIDIGMQTGVDPATAVAAMGGAAEIAGTLAVAGGRMAVRGASLWIATNFALQIGKEAWFIRDTLAELTAAAGGGDRIPVADVARVLGKTLDRIVSASIFGISLNRRGAGAVGPFAAYVEKLARRKAASRSLGEALAASRAAGGLRPILARFGAGGPPPGQPPFGIGAGFGEGGAGAGNAPGVANAYIAAETARQAAERAAAGRAHQGALQAGLGMGVAAAAAAAAMGGAPAAPAQQTYEPLTQIDPLHYVISSQLATKGGLQQRGARQVAPSGLAMYNRHGRYQGRYTAGGGGKRRKSHTKKHKKVSRKHKKGSRKH